MNFDKFNQFDTVKLTALYAALLKPRMIEEKMLKLLRQGQVSKWFSGIGQEAIAVGATLALEADEYIMPLHRNLGVFTARGIPFEKLLHQWQGNIGGFTKGRDRSFHFGTNEYHIAGMISHLGAMLSVADGVALGNLLDGKQKVSLAFSGDGGTSEGEFHEAVNLAAVWDLPVIFLVENNGYGLSTPSKDQFRCAHIADKGIGYGIESKTIDGNNILEVYTEISRIAADLRQNPRPFLLECKTFRMRGHEEASGTKYVPQELMDEWAKKDPIANFENYLLTNKLISVKDIVKIKDAT
jgi:2-oxoisovalerate dehydrogenase E1 component